MRLEEILGFVPRSRTPKRYTVKKRPPPQDDSVQDKIKQRRALASKIGLEKAMSSDALDKDDDK